MSLRAPQSGSSVFSVPLLEGSYKQAPPGFWRIAHVATQEVVRVSHHPSRPAPTVSFRWRVRTPAQDPFQSSMVRWENLDFMGGYGGFQHEFSGWRPGDPYDPFFEDRRELEAVIAATKPAATIGCAGNLAFVFGTHEAAAEAKRACAHRLHLTARTAGLETTAVRETADGWSYSFTVAQPGVFGDLFDLDAWARSWKAYTGSLPGTGVMSTTRLSTVVEMLAAKATVPWEALGLALGYPIASTVSQFRLAPRTRHGRAAALPRAGGRAVAFVPDGIFEATKPFDVGRVRFDPQEGVGAVGYSRDLDYFGFVIWMTVGQFLHLNPVRGDFEASRSAPFLREQVGKGEPLGPLMLQVEIVVDADDQIMGDLRVWGHEGRGRAIVLAERAGLDALVPVHVVPRGKLRLGRGKRGGYVELRARHLDPGQLLGRRLLPDRRADSKWRRPIVLTMITHDGQNYGSPP